MSDTPQHTTQKAVWKFGFPFPGPDTFSIDMPGFAVPLTVQIQHGEPQIWALVTPSGVKRPHRFRIAGTGQPITEALKGHVGTFQIAGGNLIFHVFEIMEDAARPPAAPEVAP